MATREEVTNCTEIHELIPAYCLGATDPEETRLVEAYLADCSGAIEEVAAYQELADGLLISVPAMEPPAGLAGKLLAATSAPARAARPVEKTAAAPTPVTRDPQPSLWQRIQAAFAGPSFRPLPVMAAIVVLALLAVNVYLVSQVRDMRGSLDDLQGRLGQQAAVLTQVGEGSYVRISLPAGPAGVSTAAYGALVCNPDQSSGFMLAEGLPPLAAGETYEVWLGQGDTMTSVGFFEPDEMGYGRVVFSAPLPMGQYDSMLITVEPAAGSDRPTTPPVIGGSLYANEYSS